MASPHSLVVTTLCAVAVLQTYTSPDAQPPAGSIVEEGDASTWFLAEGANNATFSEEILVGNPNAQAVDVTVTLLPQPDAIFAQTVRTYRMPATSRLTVRVGQEFGLNGSASARVRGVAAGTSTPAPIVVERTMYFPGVSPSGAHSASGVTALAPAWSLAEGATTIFDTFILVANPHPNPTLVQATYLTADGAELLTEQVAPPEGRITFWPRQEHATLQAAEFSTLVRSLTSGQDVVAERAMYFDGFGAGHDALGVTTPSTTWYFAEGSTGGNAQTAFETFLLLANGGTTSGVATVDYLLDSGGVVTVTYPVAARRRFTVWVDQEGRTVDARLRSAAFGIRVTATVPIVAERTVYWGTPSATDPTTPLLPWRDGHATAGAVTPSVRWAFAEGQQGTPSGATSSHHTFFLLANPHPSPLAVRATFAREDGTGIVRTVCVAPNARANIWTAAYPELAGRRFATFLESVTFACGNATIHPFVAERASYLGDVFDAGHANMGTTWSGSIATPPLPPVEPDPTIAFRLDYTCNPCTGDPDNYALNINRVSGSCRIFRTSDARRSPHSITATLQLARGTRNVEVVVRNPGAPWTLTVSRTAGSTGGVVPNSFAQVFSAAALTLGRCTVTSRSVETFMEFAVAVGSGQSVC
jgi:hypothetical protein